MPLEADIELTRQAMEPAPSKNFVQFYLHPVKDKEASIKEGRLVMKEVPYIRIRIPGDKDNVVERKVRITDQQKYPRQWEAFEQQREQPLEGTPLAQMPWVNRAQVEELAFFGIKTLEQLVAVPDSQAQKFMGMNMLRQKARDYLEICEASAPYDQLRAELEQERSEKEALKDQLRQLSKRLEALEE